MKEKRRFVRIHVSFPVECKTLPSQVYFYTVSKDLGLGGLKIISKDFLSKDSFVTVNVNLIDRILNAKGKIVWCNNRRASERYISGIEFIEMNQINRIELFELINLVENDSSFNYNHLK